MKTCSVCKQELSLSSFPRNGKYYKHKCKVCHKEHERERRKTPEGKAYMEKWRKEYRSTDHGKQKTRESNDRWEANNRHKKRAHGQVRQAVIRGDLIQESCSVCGVEKAEAHHPDYSKPLEVMWLCRKHHHEQHKLEASL